MRPPYFFHFEEIVEDRHLVRSLNLLLVTKNGSCHLRSESQSPGSLTFMQKQRESSARACQMQQILHRASIAPFDGSINASKATKLAAPRALRPVLCQRGFYMSETGVTNFEYNYVRPVVSLAWIMSLLAIAGAPNHFFA